MGARCELCGKDMLESKSCTVADIHIGGRGYKRVSPLVAGVISLKVHPKMRVAGIAAHSWDTITTGAAIANAARHAVGS